MSKELSSFELFKIREKRRADALAKFSKPNYELLEKEAKKLEKILDEGNKKYYNGK